MNWKKFINKKTILIFAILLIVIFSRFYLLDMRPLHHDEGVNGYFQNNLFNNGYYKYDPSNYHGPSLYYFTLLGYFFFDSTVLGLRIIPAIFGIAIFFLLLALRKYYSLTPFLIIILFYAASPSLSYYSRYAIHEILFVFFSLAAYLFFILFINPPAPMYRCGGKPKPEEPLKADKNLKRNPLFLNLSALSLGLAFSTKETAYSLGFIFFSYLFLADFFSLFKKEKLFYTKLFIKNWKEVLYSLFLFFLAIFLFYSNFLQNLAGSFDILKSILPWFKISATNIQGHEKPFLYYSKILIEYELPLVIFSILGIFYCLKKRKNLLLVWWTVLTYLIYSSIPYKTPWLIINITMPLVLLAGYGLMLFWKNKFWKILMIILTAGSAVYLSYYNIKVNFINYDQDAKNRFAYAHTTSDIKWVVEKIEKSGYKNIALMGKPGESYWPFPFYLQNYNVYYGLSEDSPDIGNWEILIVHNANLPEEVVEKYDSYDFQLRWNMWLKLYIKK